MITFHNFYSDCRAENNFSDSKQRQQRKIEYVLDIKEKEAGEWTCRVDGGKKLSEFKKCFSWENVVLAAAVVCARGQPASLAGAEEK